MKSRPASSAMRASRRHSGQVANQRSGTLVAERPDEQLAPKIPIFNVLSLYIAMRSRIVAVRASTAVSISFAAHPPLPAVRPELFERRLDERAVDRIIEIDHALDQPLLGIEGKIVGKARLVDRPVR